MGRIDRSRQRAPPDDFMPVCILGIAMDFSARERVDRLNRRIGVIAQAARDNRLPDVGCLTRICHESDLEKQF